MSTYSWDFGSAAEGLQFTITYDTVAKSFTVNVIQGSMDLNALWFDDKSGPTDSVTLAKADSSLNMNGSNTVWTDGEESTAKIAWDDYLKLSSTGLGSAGTEKSTYLTAGETATFAVTDLMTGDAVTDILNNNYNWANVTLGVRATSTSTDGGGIKWVDNDANVAPTIGSSGSANFAENATGIAYDPDASDGDGDTLTYSLSGTDASLFNIDPLNGKVSFKNTPDYENAQDASGDNVYDIIINVSDGVLTTTKNVSISVTNVNEAPTVTSGATGSVAENAPTSTIVYDAAGTDPDAGDTIEWSLTGTDAGAFNIDPTTGEVTLKASADYETKTSYSINVVATDDGNLTNSKAVTISVTNVNEAPTVTSGATGSVAENAPTSTIVYDAAGTDPDAGDTGTDAGAFNIDPTTGEVTLKASADYETKTSYSINVVATDDGNLTNSKAVTISVTNVNEGTTIAQPFMGTGDPNDFDNFTATATTTDWNPTNGNDTKVGTTAGEAIDGGNGNDILIGGAGDDILKGNNDVDTIYGQAGVDQIDGGNQSDSLYGGSGNDTILGANDADTIYGGSGSDTINAGGGDDVIVGGYGRDFIDVSVGNDTVRFLSAQDTGDEITGFGAGDVLDFDALNLTGGATAGSSVVAFGVNYFADGGNTKVWVDSDGITSTVEMEITLMGLNGGLNGGTLLF